MTLHGGCNNRSLIPARRAHLRRSCAFALAIVGLLARSALAVRIAVVTEGGQTVSQTIDLAQAQLTQADPGIQFVERAGIAKILAEQKLSLSGLVNAQQAVQVGTLLKADLLAVVETDENHAQPSGVVIFDAHTGERFGDKALEGADEKTAATLAEALRESVRKVAIPAAKRRPICLLTVRNVDLPKADDPFCKAVATLVERRLLTSPDVVLLERERLNEIRKESELPGESLQNTNLIASLTLLELQVAREQGDKVRATCVLSDGQGKRTGDAVSAVSGPHLADQLAAALAVEVAKALKVAPLGAPDNPTARKAEALRFYREAQFWWAHHDYERPVCSMEAAAALDPENTLIQAEFARTLILAGLTRIESAFAQSDFAGYRTPSDLALQTFLKQQISADDVSDSLALMQVATKRLIANSKNTADPEAEKVSNAGLKMLVAYLRGIEVQQERKTPGSGNASRPALTTPEHLAAFRQIRLDYWNLQRLRSKSPSLPEASDWDSAMQATAAFQDMLMDPDFYATATREQLLLELKEYITQWRDMWLRHPPTGSPCIRGITTLLEPDRIKEAVNHGPISSTSQLPFSASETQIALAFYEALGQIKDPLCAATADKGKAWLKPTLAKDDPKNKPQLSNVPRRLPKLLTAGRGGVEIIEAAPTTAPAPEEFWKERTLLFDLSLDAAPKTQSMTRPIPFGNSVYLVRQKLAAPDQKPSLDLVRIDLSKPLTGLPEPPGPKPKSSNGGLVIQDDTTSSIAGGYYILISHVAPLANPITLFPLDGTEPIRLNADRGFDLQRVSAATVLDGKLYAAAGSDQGLLIAYDIANKTSKTLAASKRTDIQSPFDNQPPMRIPILVADPARDRIVFNASAPGWSKELAGMWEYNVKTAKFTGLTHPTRDIPKDTPFQEIHGGGYAGQVLNDKFVWHAGNSRGISSIAIFDLHANELLPSRKFKPPGHPGFITNLPVVAMTEHYTWTTWGRVRLSDDSLQEFPSLVPSEDPLAHPRGYVPLDDKRIIAYDRNKIWLLTPPEEGTARRPEPSEKPSKLPPPIIPPEGGELPWTTVHTLYDHIRDTDKIDMYISPRVVGNDIFVLGIGHDLTKDLRPRGGTQEEMKIGFAQLLKVPKTGGPMKPLAKLAITGVQDEQKPENRLSGRTRSIATVALDDHNLYAAMDGEPCIGVFPLDGSPARKITLDWRTNQLVMLDGQLFAAWEQIWRTNRTVLASIDAATGKTTPIITATEGKPPEWSTQKAYYPRIIDLWSDAPRHRILYLAHGPTPDPANDGIWEYTPATGQKRLRLPLLIAEGGNDPFGPSPVFWTGTNADGRILIFNRRGLFAFDPATDTAKVIMQHHPDLDPLATVPTDPKGPHAPVSPNDMLSGKMMVERPCAIANGYLWFSNGRASLDGRTVEKFPPLRNGPQFNPADDGLLFLNGGKQLLVSDFYGAWILDMRP